MDVKQIARLQAKSLKSYKNEKVSHPQKSYSQEIVYLLIISLVQLMDDTHLDKASAWQTKVKMAEQARLIPAD